jgi:hypothetical protein
MNWDQKLYLQALAVTSPLFAGLIYMGFDVAGRTGAAITVGVEVWVLGGIFLMIRNVTGGGPEEK